MCQHLWYPELQRFALVELLCSASSVSNVVNYSMGNLMVGCKLLLSWSLTSAV